MSPQQPDSAGEFLQNMVSPQYPPGPPYVHAFQPGPPDPVGRRRRRIFPWVFLAIQVLFVILLIVQIAGGSDVHAQAVAYCHAHPDQYLPFSQCVSDYGTGGKAGTAIGAGLLVVLWAVADVILGISYGVWRLARR